MKQRRSLRLLGISSSVVLLLAIAGYLVPMDSFRPLIESQISASVGRKVQIGHLHLSLATGSLRADNVAIADDPAFSTSDFLRAESLEVGVDLRQPVFSRNLQITFLQVQHPHIVALRSARGAWNFASLGAPAAGAVQTHGPPPVLIAVLTTGVPSCSNNPSSRGKVCAAFSASPSGERNANPDGCPFRSRWPVIVSGDALLGVSVLPARTASNLIESDRNFIQRGCRRVRRPR